MIFIDGNKIKVQKFNKILRASDSCLFVEFEKQKVMIEGSKLLISFLEMNEIILNGEIKKIEFIYIR